MVNYILFLYSKYEILYSHQMIYFLDPLGHQIPYSLGEDNQGNVSLIIVKEPTSSVAWSMVEISRQNSLFCRGLPLFEMDNYNENNNIIERPFCIKLKEQTLEFNSQGVSTESSYAIITNNLVLVIKFSLNFQFCWTDLFILL